jgi:type I restriction enzyme S subunit
MTNRSDWELVRIKDIGTVKTGRTPPTVVASNFGDEYLFVTPSDMDGRKRIDDTERKVSSQGASVLASCRLPANSVCVSCIGWQMGKVVMTTQTCFTNQQINTIIPNDKVLPDFLYYHLSTRREEFKMLGSVGTRTPILKKSLFENLGISLPPLPIQRKIAGILSAYDRLIENNTRRIEILEKMARSIYREWFVKFRFPGHEQVQMVESELGLIPEGWEIKKVGDVAKVISGYAFKSNDFQEKGIPVIKIKNIRVGTVDLSDAQCVDPRFLSLDARYHVKGINLLISLTGSHLTQPNSVVGRVAIYSPHQGHCLLNQRSGKFLIKNPRYCDIPFLFYFLSSEEKRRDIALIASGAASQANISPTQVENLDLLIPSSDILDVFHRIAASSLEEINNLEAKNANLRKTRDLLLPRLISGEIDVENLDINTGSIAA